jgi:hypothetical protein
MNYFKLFILIEGKPLSGILIVKKPTEVGFGYLGDKAN